MDLWVTNCILIPGDGRSVFQRGLLGVQGGLIEVVADQQPDPLPEGPVLDAAGGYLLPGIVNIHTHGCCTGPLFSSGAPGVSLDVAVENVRRHLAQGETTLCDLSGLGTAADAEQVRAATPVTIGLGTCHFEETFTAARLVDGTGIAPRHEQVSARQMLEQGDAVAIGEVGSGATLGGGVASYRYIPESIRQISGVTIGWAEADRLKASVLADHFAPVEELASLLDEFGLAGRIRHEQVRELVIRYVRKPIAAALDGFGPGAALAAATGFPVLFHTCKESVAKMLEIAGQYPSGQVRMIAGHANHNSLSEEDCVRSAGELRNRGVAIDVATVQCFSGMPAILANTVALLSAGLVDAISTDYGGGRWDSMLSLVAYMVQERLASLPKAVALATSFPATLFPRIGSDRGLLAPGRRADFVLTAPGSLAELRRVFCTGKQAFVDARAGTGLS
jgi:imidazolonepropionase-like amidohydrolase